MLLKGTKSPIVMDMGGFVARLNMPGWLLPWPKDHGHGPLAMVVESILEPGRVIKMHEHKNDEIVSWVPDGVMRHDDRANGPLITDANHLMVMNAGRSFWHSEETLLTDPPLRMLQILIRPRALDLEPVIQHGPIKAGSLNEWRHLFGPETGSAPFYVRNEVDFFDIDLETDRPIAFPRMQARELYFYVFRGSIQVEEKVFNAREQGLFRSSTELRLLSLQPSKVVAFLTNPDAIKATQGTVGDHRRIPPPYLGRPLTRVLRVREWWRGSK